MQLAILLFCGLDNVLFLSGDPEFSLRVWLALALPYCSHSCFSDTSILEFCEILVFYRDHMYYLWLPG